MTKDSDPLPYSGAIFIHGAALYRIATDANRASQPLVAIVFAALTCETFINELDRMAAYPRRRPEPPEVGSLATLLSEAEDSRASITLKYLLAKDALTGQPFDKGAQPYQDFALLVELRNVLVHAKEDRVIQEQGTVREYWPKVIRSLEAKRLLLEPRSTAVQFVSWIGRVSTPAVARWACNAAVGIITDLMGSLPESGLRVDTRNFYASWITPIP